MRSNSVANGSRVKYVVLWTLNVRINFFLSDETPKNFVYVKSYRKRKRKEARRKNCLKAFEIRRSIYKNHT